MLSLRWEDPLLILNFKVERHALNLDFLSWEKPPLTWVTSAAGNLTTWKKEAFALRLLALMLTLPGKSIPSLALEPTSSGLQGILKTS